MRLRAGATVTMGINPGQSVIGSPDADTIRLGAAGQFVDANGGNDTILGSIAALNGGAMVNGGTGSDRVVLTDGGSIDLQLVGSVNVETYELTAAAQIRAGTARPVTILGSAGADDITLRVTGSTATAGAGDDVLRTQAAGVTLQAGDGQDVFVVTAADQAAWSGAANTLNGGSAPNQLDVMEVQLGAGVQITLDLTQHSISGIDRVRVAGGDTGASLVLTINDATLATADGNNGGSFGDFNVEATQAVLGDVTVNAGSLTNIRVLRFDIAIPAVLRAMIPSRAATASTPCGLGPATIRCAAMAVTTSWKAATARTASTAAPADDILRGDSGNDSILAGEGADDVTGGAGGDSIALGEAAAALDRVRFSDIADGSGDINAIVLETTADRIIGFDPTTDQVVLNRSGSALGAGAVLSVGANGAWKLGAAAVFVFDSLDTLSGDNFGDIAQMAPPSTSTRARPAGPRPGGRSRSSSATSR